MLWHKVQGAGGVGGASLEYIGHKRYTGSVTVTRGADYEERDLLFNYMQYYSNTLINDEVGWTLINRALYSVYQSFAFSRIIATANTSYTTNNGNRDNVIVVFRPTGYSTFSEVDEDEGLNGGTASITMTDTNDSIYMGFGSASSGAVVDVAVPSFANIVDVDGAGDSVKFYWAYQKSGHGNTGTQTLDVSGTFELCTAIQLDLT